MPVSKSSAVWEGSFKEGSGRFEAASGAFSGSYTAVSRFEGAAGTTPEELIAAAHAACFSMALNVGLERAGTPATRISTTASCTLEKVEAGFRITKMHLETEGTVPGLDAAAFSEAAERAKVGCPVSNALNASIAITVSATLV